MADPLEFYAGQPVNFVMKFWDIDPLTGDETPGDPTAATLAIQVGYTDPPITVDIANFAHAGTGVFTYSWPTGGMATDKKVDVAAQVQSSLGLAAVSDPQTFVLLPPKVPILT